MKGEITVDMKVNPASATRLEVTLEDQVVCSRPLDAGIDSTAVLTCTVDTAATGADGALTFPITWTDLVARILTTDGAVVDSDDRVLLLNNEHPNPQVGDTVYGWLVKGETDTLTFQGREGQDVIVFFQVLEHWSVAWRGTMQLNVYDPQQRAFTFVQGYVSAGTPDFYMMNSYRKPLPLDGTYTVTIQGREGETALATGAYRFQVFPINRAPETIARSIRIGDVVSGEALSPKGDLDEFTFSAAAGDRLIAQLQSSDMPYEGMVLEVRGPGGVQIAYLRAPEASTDLSTYEREFTAQESGEHTVVIRSYSERGAGSYTFRIRR